MKEYYSPSGKCVYYPAKFPAQCQRLQPGVESILVPRPVFENPNYIGTGKLKDKVAIITGGDSGIGRAVAIAYAKEGADISIIYLSPRERGDALETKKRINELGRRCVLMEGDAGQEANCKEAVKKTIQILGRIDIVVNNAGIQPYEESIEQVSASQLERVFRTNIFACFYLIKAAIPHLKRGSSIINTASITAYTGHKNLLDYSSTKGAMVTLTRSLSSNLIDKGIRVNAVAPGPVWTPLNPACQPPQNIPYFGTDMPIGKPAQPAEVAPAFVFLASNADSSQVTGQVIHVNGGYIVNG